MISLLVSICIFVATITMHWVADNEAKKSRKLLEEIGKRR